MKRLVLLTMIALSLGLAQTQDQLRKVKDEIQKTARLMKEFTPLVNQSNNAQAQELWRMAQGEQSTAEDYLRKERYRLAVKFTLAARTHGRSALGIIKRKADPERLRRGLERTDALIARASEPIKSSGNQQAIDLLMKATDWQQQAWAAFKEKRFPQAVKLGLAARDLVLRAWESARRNVGIDLVERAIAENDGLIKEWSDDIRQAGNSEAQSLLDQAIGHQETARRHLADKKLKPALAEAGAARRLLKRAIELVQTDDVAPGKNPR